MEILNQFGFKPDLFFAQVVNFLILAYVFKRFLYTPLLKTLKEREEKIKKGIEDAKESAEMLQKTEEDRERILKKTRIEAEKIINDVKKDADEEKERILNHARTEAEKIVKQGKMQADLEMEKIKKNIGNISLEMSQKILNTILSSFFSGNEKNEITKRATKELEKMI